MYFSFISFNISTCISIFIGAIIINIIIEFIWCIWNILINFFFFFFFRYFRDIIFTPDFIQINFFFFYFIIFFRNVTIRRIFLLIFIFFFCIIVISSITCRYSNSIFFSFVCFCIFIRHFRI